MLGSGSDATGSWQKPIIPDYHGQNEFTGGQIHSGNYHSPTQFAGKRILVFGGGNSGAQIMAQVSLVYDATWVTFDEPQFLPDDINGRVLFDAASECYQALTSGAKTESSKTRDLLGSIVVVEPVKVARDGGRLKYCRPFKRFTQLCIVWSVDGSEESIDGVNLGDRLSARA